MSFRVLFKAFFAAVVILGRGCGKPPAASEAGSNPAGSTASSEGNPQKSSGGSGPETSMAGRTNPGAAQRKLPTNSAAGQILGVEVAIGSVSSWGRVEYGQRIGGPVFNTELMKALTGTVDLRIPTKDPASVVAASYATDAGKLLAGPELKAVGVEITLLKPNKKDALSYEIHDPKGAVGAVDWFDAEGKKLELFGPFISGKAPNPITVSFSSPVGPIPMNAVVKFYLLTDKSVVSVPFEFKHIPVPQSK